MPRGLFAVMVELLLVANLQIIENISGLIRTGVENQYPYCPMDAQRRASLRQARAVLRSDPDARMLVGQNLLPKLVDLPNAHLPAEFAHAPVEPYRWVLLEKPPLGKTWPLGDGRIEALIERFRVEPGTQVIIDDAGVFFARGRFID